MMNGRLNPGVEPCVDRSGLEGDREDHSLELPSLTALGHISNVSADVTTVKFEEPSVSQHQGLNPGQTVSVPPPRALLPVSISSHSLSVPPSWPESVILATCPGGGHDLAATETDLPPSSVVLDVVTTTHPDGQGPERCDADTPAEISDDPHSGAQRWTGGPKTVLVELSNISLTDLHLGDDPSLQPGPMVALDVVGRSGVDCDEPGTLLESPTDSHIVPYLEPSWPAQPSVPIPLGVTLSHVLVISGGGGVGGGPQSVEEDNHSAKDPSVPTPETNKKQDVDEEVLSCWSVHKYPRVMLMDGMTIVGKEKEKELREKEMKMVSFPDSTQFFNTEDCLNQKMPSCEDTDKLNSVSHDKHTRYLKVPKEIQRNEQPYPCSVWTKEFDCESNLPGHQRISLGEKPYNRSVCTKTCTQVSNLHQHRRFHTGEKPKQGEKNQKQVHTGKKPYECSVCAKVFNQLSNLNKHKRVHTGEKLYECSVCAQVFNQLSNLNKHKRIHTGEKPYECSVCTKVFRHSLTLKNHKLTHTGEKPYKCSECSQPFRHLSNLNKHKRIHTGEKPYECSVCAKVFRHSLTLKNHKRTHTGEKPYECSVCSQLFRQLSNLNKHKRVHTGEKPYECSVCAKVFRQSSNLKSHKLTHTGEKPYKCSVCSKVFRDLSTLNNHKRIHTEEKPYKCYVCFKDFRQLSHLIKHKRLHTELESKDKR